jgi:GDP-L-fucose synthase
MNKEAKIYVAGHAGLVGSAIMRALKSNDYENIVTKTFQDLDLRRQEKVEGFFSQERPDCVFFAAAKVGGIHANNKYKAEFIYDNLMIATNVIHAAYKYKVKKLLNLGSSCIYPKHAPQPLKEEYLLTGPLEPTNEPYAIAKIAAIKLCQYYNEQYGTSFISAMPTNLYGPHDNFNLETAHVLPALIRKFHTAIIENHKEVTIWGTGAPYREFLYVDDLAQAILFLMEQDAFETKPFINIGTGRDLTIKELAILIKKITRFEGSIKFDLSKPDGTPKKQLDISKIEKLGWKNRISLEQGIKQTYQWYLENIFVKGKICEANYQKRSQVIFKKAQKS